MKNTPFFILATLLFTFACSSVLHKEVPVVDANSIHSDSVLTFVVKPERGVFRTRATPLEPVSVKAWGIAGVEDGNINLKSKTRKECSGIMFRGNWNLAECNTLVLELSNHHPEKEMPVVIRLENPDADLAKSKGVLVERKLVSPGETAEVSVPIPPKFPFPEIEDKIEGLRYTPYRQQGILKNIDPGRITLLAIYIDESGSEWPWSVKRVYARKGEPEKLPGWMYIPEKDFFPFIDAYGQFIHKEWPGKTKSDEDLKEALKDELADIESHPGPEGWSRYGGWMEGPRMKATGQFRVEKINGKWWMIDPEGYLYWSHGVVRVTPSSSVTPLDGRESYFSSLPEQGDPFAEFYTTHDTLLYPYYLKRGIKKTFDFSSANLIRKYGQNWRGKFGDMVHQRLKSWGLNTIANSSDRSVCLMRRTPYCDRIELKSPDLEGSRDGWWKFRDPFHPEFRTTFRKQLSERKSELDDPWCIGFFVDNELSWGGASSLAEWTLQSPSTQPAKREFVNRLKTKYGTIGKLNEKWKSDFKDWNRLLESQEKPAAGSSEDCIIFSGVIAEEYFKIVREEFKKAAPEKLYLGCRFAGMSSADESVVRLAAKYSDVLSYNIYKTSLADFKLPEGIDKPVMIGEFTFGALDRGLFYCGVQTDSQEKRAEAYLTYVESALRHPNFVGTHWFQYSDMGVTGRFDGANAQIGLTDVCDKPYAETIAKVREVGYKMYKIRSE